MFSLLLLPLFLFKTTDFSNSAIILTPRSNTFQEDMVAHLLRKFSAFCNAKTSLSSSQQAFSCCLIQSYDLRYILIYPLCKHAHLKLYFNVYHISHARYMHSPSHPSWFDHPNHSCCKIQIKSPHFEIVSILLSFPYFQRPFLSLLSLLASGCAFGNTVRRFSYKYTGSLHSL